MWGDGLSPGGMVCMEGSNVLALALGKLAVGRRVISIQPLVTLPRPDIPGGPDSKLHTLLKGLRR